MLYATGAISIIILDAERRDKGTLRKCFLSSSFYSTIKEINITNNIFITLKNKKYLVRVEILPGEFSPSHVLNVLIS